MWTAIVAAWLAVREWASRSLAAATPQRADFEAVTKQWETLVASLRRRIEDLEDENVQDRERYDRRIAALEASEQKCEKDRLLDLVRIAKLEETVRSLQSQIEYLVKEIGK